MAQEHKALAERLAVEIKRLDDVPPSIQSQANIRLVNAVREAIAALSAPAVVNPTADRLLRRLQWTGRTQGPGTSMGASDGEWVACCPMCRGLREPNGGFIPEAVGHRLSCELGKYLKENCNDKA